MAKNCILVGGYILLGIALAGFWASLIVINNEGKNEAQGSGTMPYYPRDVSYFELKKDMGFEALMWRWQYTTEIGTTIFEAKQVCFSPMHDVHLFVNGDIAYRTESQYFTLTSDMHIYDKLGNKRYKITTGDFLITLLNMNKIAVNFHMEDLDGNTVMYAEKTDYFQIATYFKFRDVNQTVIAEATKDITVFPWTWRVNLYMNATTTKIEYPVLMAIFAQSSFTEGGDENSTDFCNNYFYVVGIGSIILSLVFVILTFYLAWASIYACCCPTERLYRSKYDNYTMTTFDIEKTYG